MGMSSRKIANALGNISKGVNELGNGTVLLSIAGISAARELSPPDFSFLGLGDCHQLTDLVPLLGIIVGGLKVMNGLSSLWIGCTEWQSPEKPEESETRERADSNELVDEPLTVSKDDDEDNDWDHVDEQAAKNIDAITSLSDLTKESRLSAGLEIFSGCLIGLSSYEAYDPFMSLPSYLPSIALLYLSFATSALINLIRTLPKLWSSYLNKEGEEILNTPPQDRFCNVMADAAVHLFKCIGWSILAYASIVGAAPLVMAVGWSAIGMAALLQLGRVFDRSPSVCGSGWALLFPPAYEKENPNQEMELALQYTRAATRALR